MTTAFTRVSGSPEATTAERTPPSLEQRLTLTYVTLLFCTSGDGMQTKLTLRLEQKLIRRAKSYAKRTGKSVSALVAECFTRLDSAPAEPRGVEGVRSPAVRSLVGVIAERGLDEGDYRRHLARKHR